MFYYNVPLTLLCCVTLFATVAFTKIYSKIVSKYFTKRQEILGKINGTIKETITNYSIDRLNLVDKAIIRVATGEMLLNKLDRRIIINEALEITKLYSDQGDHKATSFNNRLLDNISKKI